MAAPPSYTVIVGNIGQVLTTTDRTEAYRTYHAYILDSRNQYGRAAGEPVTLMEDGEPIHEYAGTLEEE